MNPAQLGFQSLHSLAHSSPSPTSKLFALSVEHAQLQRSLADLGGTNLLEMREVLAEKEGEIGGLNMMMNRMMEEVRKLKR